MKILFYIIIALFITFQANAQGKKSKKSQEQTTEQTAENQPIEAYSDASAIVIEPDVYPMLNGGPTDFIIYVNRNMKYPESAVNDKVQGKVMVIATVAPDGSVIDAEIANGLRDDVNQEALRLVREMPKWHPAELGGRRVTSKAVVMVPFKLEKDAASFK